MKNLLRMSLFIVARAGLFLAIVAWIVGQWLTGGGTCPLGVVLVCDSGWICAVDHDLRFAWEFSVAPTQAGDLNLHFVKPPKSNRRIGFSLCGVTGWRTIVKTSVSIRHWLIVTFFALFYGVLKWVYRKPGRVVVDE